MRPAIGETILLVYRECLCGEWCATGEGAVAPICPRCGRRMMPPSGPLEDDRNEYRREHGLGFAAMLENEFVALRKVPPLTDAQRRPTRSVQPHYDPEALKRRLEGWAPTDPVWGPGEVAPWETLREAAG